MLYSSCSLPTQTLVTDDLAATHLGVHEISYLDYMIHYTASKEMSACVKLVQTQIVCGRPVEASKPFKL